MNGKTSEQTEQEEKRIGISADQSKTDLEHEQTTKVTGRTERESPTEGTETPEKKDPSTSSAQVPTDSAQTPVEVPPNQCDASEQVEALKTENERLRTEIAQTRIEQELLWAAKHEAAIDPAQVTLLMKDRVRLDENLKPMVVDAGGTAVLDEYGQPVTVADAVRAFLDRNTHLLQPTVRPMTSQTNDEAGGSGLTALTGRTTLDNEAWSGNGTSPRTGGELIAEALRAGA